MPGRIHSEQETRWYAWTFLNRIGVGMALNSSRSDGRKCTRQHIWLTSASIVLDIVVKRRDAPCHPPKAGHAGKQRQRPTFIHSCWKASNRPTDRSGSIERIPGQPRSMRAFIKPDKLTAPKQHVLKPQGPPQQKLGQIGFRQLPGMTRNQWPSPAQSRLGGTQSATRQLPPNPLR